MLALLSVITRPKVQPVETLIAPIHFPTVFKENSEQFKHPDQKFEEVRKRDKIAEIKAKYEELIKDIEKRRLLKQQEENGWLIPFPTFKQEEQNASPIRHRAFKQEHRDASPIRYHSKNN